MAVENFVEMRDKVGDKAFMFAKEVEKGQIRRSRLSEFIEGSREAAKQLVANLQRAGELIQNFKQVAVDRKGNIWTVDSAASGGNIYRYTPGTATTTVTTPGTLALAWYATAKTTPKGSDGMPNYGVDPGGADAWR